MSRRTQRATAVALSALLIPVLAGCVLQPGGPDESTPPETTTVEETDNTTTDPTEETEETDTTEETDETSADAATFTSADDFLSQYESAVEPCVDTQTQDVASLVGEEATALGLDGATMGSCLVDETGSYASAVVLPDTSASINDVEAKAPGFLEGLLQGSQGDSLVVGGNWVVILKGVPDADVIAAFGGETVTP